MHEFEDLVESCAELSLSQLSMAHAKVSHALQTSGATRHVRALQVIQLQKAIIAVGMFSIFDARLQDRLGGAKGFVAANDSLENRGKEELRDRFYDLQLAVNVLKHGRGRSYDELIARAERLPFRVKRPNEAFFCEGDVSEVSTLVEVDDHFVALCATVIREVSEALDP